MEQATHGSGPNPPPAHAEVAEAALFTSNAAPATFVLTPREGAWHVSLPVFEGPLDLLLYLVRRQKIAIVDIPLAKLTEQYLAYVELMQRLQLDLAAEFLVMAATLVLWKSRELLPGSIATADDGAADDDDDLRAALIRQLAEYDALRRCAAWLQQTLTINNLIRRKVPLPPLEPPPVAPPSTVDLALTFAMLIRKRRAQAPRVLHIAELRIEEHFAPLREFAARGGVFQDYLEQLDGVATWVAAFLALLFLFQHGEVRVTQPQPFGPIYLHPCA